MVLYIILYYIIIHYYYYTYTIIYYYILYYTLLFSQSSFSFPISSSPLLLSQSISSIYPPSFKVYVSGLTSTYLYSSNHSYLPKVLTPHVLSEWLVEVWCVYLCGGWFWAGERLLMFRADVDVRCYILYLILYSPSSSSSYSPLPFPSISSSFPSQPIFLLFLSSPPPLLFLSIFCSLLPHPHPNHMIYLPPSSPLTPILIIPFLFSVYSFPSFPIILYVSVLTYTYLYSFTIFQDNPLLIYLPFPSPHPHSKYTCRYLHILIYIFWCSRQSDPACFIGVDGWGV